MTATFLLEKRTYDILLSSTTASYMHIPLDLFAIMDTGR